MTKELVCVQCGDVNQGKTITKGSIIIEIILWLCFLFPGLIYSIWRLTTRYRACRLCGGSTLIPVDSPAGKRILKD
jgi:hypothetical protein